MKELSQRDQECLDFICEFLTAHGYPPTIREIAEAMNIKSPNGVKFHLESLRNAGRLTWTKGASRTIQVKGEA